MSDDPYQWEAPGPPASTSGSGSGYGPQYPSSTPGYGSHYQYGSPYQHAAPNQYGIPNQYGTPGSQDYRPGIIALRPLGFGEFFDGAFRAIQHNPRVMFGLSLVVAILSGLLQALVTGLFLQNFLALEPDTPFPDDELLLETFGGMTATLLLAGIITALATLILNGLLITSVSQSVIGRKVSVRAVWQQAKGQIWRLLGLTMLIGVIEFAILVLLVVITVAAVAGIVNTSSETVGLLLGIGLFLLSLGAIAVFVYFYIRIAVASPALMMERTGALRALGRSWQLTKGYGLRNTGVLLLAVVIVSAISAVTGAPVGALGIALAALPPELMWLALTLPVFLSSLITAIITPFLAGIVSLLYIDLRMRKEGLDVELIRAAGSQ